MTNLDTSSVYTDINGLAKLKVAAREQSPAAIKEVAKQFESVFLNMVMKSMRQAKLADSMLDSKQSEFYQDMYDQQMAIQLSGKPGVGLADMIVKQLSPKPKPDEDQKMQAVDYLNRALGGSSQTAVTHSNPAEKTAKSLDPMEESGYKQPWRAWKEASKTSTETGKPWNPAGNRN
jgi:flagellar protein FlgJ